ncbi:MAG: BON domain-containing protein [Steroidobacteraceae bacterium]
MLIEYRNCLLLAVVALAAALALAACSTTPHRTSAERAADAELAARVRSALSADHDIYSWHIDVDVNRGVVELKGFVYEDKERQLAQSDAESVPGVHSVDMEIALMGGGISSESSN